MNLTINTDMDRLLESLGHDYSMDIIFRDDSNKVKKVTYVDHSSMKRFKEFEFAEVSKNFINIFEILADKGNRIFLVGMVSGGTHEHPKTKYESLHIVAGANEPDAIEVYKKDITTRFPLSWEVKVFGEIKWENNQQNW